MNKDKLNILLVTSELPPLPGGIGTHTHHLAGQLHNLGYKVTVLSDSRTFSSQEEIECLLQASGGTTFNEGEYQVCISADIPTDYRINTESQGVNCGFPYDLGPSSSTKDYALFVKTANYENASFLNTQEFDFENLALAADDLIQRKYAGNCTNTCFLPIKATGVAQNLEISDAEVGVRINYEDQVENNVHKLNIIPAKVFFSGILNF